MEDSMSLDVLACRRYTALSNCSADASPVAPRSTSRQKAKSSSNGGAELITCARSLSRALQRPRQALWMKALKSRNFSRPRPLTLALSTNCGQSWAPAVFSTSRGVASWLSKHTFPIFSMSLRCSSSDDFGPRFSLLGSFGSLKGRFTSFRMEVLRPPPLAC